MLGKDVTCGGPLLWTKYVQIYTIYYSLLRPAIFPEIAWASWIFVKYCLFSHLPDLVRLSFSAGRKILQQFFCASQQSWEWVQVQKEPFEQRLRVSKFQHYFCGRSILLHTCLISLKCAWKQDYLLVPHPLCLLCSFIYSFFFFCRKSHVSLTSHIPFLV